METPSPPIYIIDGSKPIRQFAQTYMGSITPGIEAIYVDYKNGFDYNPGTKSKPLKTSKAAMAIVRSRETKNDSTLDT